MLKQRFGPESTLDKVKEYINTLNKQIAEGKEPSINLVLNPNK